MPEWLRKIRWDEKSRLIAVACVCALLLVAAALLPLAFRTSDGEALPAPQSGGMTAKERAAIFVNYWYYNAEGLSVECPDAPDRSTAALCDARMEELIARCIDDQALADRTPTGSDYVEVTGEAGTLRLSRMWLEAKGDWRNWMDVCFDADTGWVYYLYISRECLANRNRYSMDAYADAEEIAEKLAEHLGGSVRNLFLDEKRETAMAALSVDGGTLFYEISGNIYDTLIDVRINCMS